MLELFAQATALSTPEPIVLATDHLVLATWALVVVGGLTFIAAIAAAIFAGRAYQLEADPGVVITRIQHVDVASGEMLPLRIVMNREESPGELFLGDELLFGLTAHTVPKASTWYAVHNIGRAPIVDLQLVCSLGVTRGIPQGSGEITVAAVPPNSRMVLPLLSALGTPGFIDVTAASQAVLQRSPQPTVERRRRPLRFVADTLVADLPHTFYAQLERDVWRERAGDP